MKININIFLIIRNMVKQVEAVCFIEHITNMWQHNWSTLIINSNFPQCFDVLNLEKSIF